MTGNIRTFLAAILLSLITPVVVSSVEPTIFLMRSFLSPWIAATRSAPSSIVIWGFASSTAFMC